MILPATILILFRDYYDAFSAAIMTLSAASLLVPLEYIHRPLMAGERSMKEQPRRTNMQRMYLIATLCLVFALPGIHAYAQEQKSAPPKPAVSSMQALL